MAAPFDPTDPADLTAEQRLAELSRLLALGVTRALALRPSPFVRSAEDPLRNPPGMDLMSPPTSGHMTSVVNAQAEQREGVER